MLISCQYCHRIHQDNYDCGMRPQKRRQTGTAQQQFRNTVRWQRKSLEIRQRDHFLCQCCIRKYHGTVRQYNTDGLSVHHNIPIAENRERALDNSNLITLCQYHHEMAEAGRISRAEIQEIIDEQERGGTPGGM